MIYMRNITITTAKSATYLENVGLEAGIRRIDLVEFVVIVRALGGDPAALLAVLIDAVPPDTRI